MAADMFTDPLPPADSILLCNILHDWDVADCRRLVRRCLKALPRGGRLVIHDTFLDDDLGGPLHAALHSSSLFLVTEGRLYSRAEILAWAGPGAVRANRGLVPTANGYAALEMTKR